MLENKPSRHVLTSFAIILLLLAGAYSFWPEPAKVEVAFVTRGNISQTINEEAKTRFHDTFIISSPVAGVLARVHVEPGDAVFADKTVVANLLPTTPMLLNERQTQQVSARIDAVSAKIKAMESLLERAELRFTFSQKNYERALEQVGSKLISQLQFEQAETGWQIASSEKQLAYAQLHQAYAELELEKANLVNGAALESRVMPQIPIKTPVDGVILTVMQKSEVAVGAGHPIVEIGDINNELEVVAELISTDAVKVAPGDQVNIVNWGGEGILNGRVKQIEPFGFTKFSALGVEEQRVKVIIGFEPAQSDTSKLGHGYRVEVEVLVEQIEDTYLIPSGSLFRIDGDWAVYLIEDEHLVIKKVVVGINNGSQANIIDGLQAGQRVVVYPASDLVSGMKVVAQH